MPTPAVLIVGAGHLAHRIRKLAVSRGYLALDLPETSARAGSDERSSFEVISDALTGLDLSAVSAAFLVDDKDERNLELLVALMARSKDIRITASLFNESIAPHLRAANAQIQILNPARIAAPTFIRSLDTPVERSLRYTPVASRGEVASRRADKLWLALTVTFASLLVVATIWFHLVDKLSWLNAAYFVIVTVATVGYGDITLLNASTASKLVGIGLILSSTFFIWMIFSLTVDRIIKQRAELSLGRKRYAYTGHVILCGLGRLGYFIGKALLDRGEQLVIVERDESSPSVEYFRRRGADVYIGDARRPRVLQDVAVNRAKAVYSVINNDFANLEIGLNARSFAPDLRLILRIFDEAMSAQLKHTLDIHLTHSMTAIADEQFFETLAS